MTTLLLSPPVSWELGLDVLREGVCASSTTIIFCCNLCDIVSACEYVSQMPIVAKAAWIYWWMKNGKSLVLPQKLLSRKRGSALNYYYSPDTWILSSSAPSQGCQDHKRHKLVQAVNWERSQHTPHTLPQQVTRGPGWRNLANRNLLLATIERRAHTQRHQNTDRVSCCRCRDSRAKTGRVVWFAKSVRPSVRLTVFSMWQTHTTPEKSRHARIYLPSMCLSVCLSSIFCKASFPLNYGYLLLNALK